MAKAKEIPLTLNPLDEVLSIMAEAVAEWKAVNTEKKLKKRVKDLLDKNSETITMKLLGFNDSWGKWELDHCNGRSGESAAGDYLKKVKQAAIQEWMESLELPKISPALKAKLGKQLKDEFENKVRYAARSFIEQKATQGTTKALEEITSSKNLDSYLKTISLLSQGIPNAS